MNAHNPSASRGAKIALAIGLALAAFAVCLAGAAEAKKRPPAKPLYWGAVIGDQITGTPPPWDMRGLEIFERRVGKKASLLNFASPFADCSSTPCRLFPFPTQAVEALRQRGTIPMLTWGSQWVPSNPEKRNIRLSEVAGGAFDSYIRGFAEQAAEWGRPFFLRFNPEMNGFWFTWSEGINRNRKGEFVAAWRHVHDIFREVGATNATWVWCPNVDYERRLTPLHGLYPGDAYVDWTCLDGFNWGTTRNSSGWHGFGRIFHSTYKRVLKIAPRKPVVIAEIASDTRGGSKAEWIRSMLRAIPAKYRKIRGIVWYNEPDQGMHWTLENDAKARKAFKREIRRRVYRPNVFADLPPGPIQPPGPHLAAPPR